MNERGRWIDSVIGKMTTDPCVNDVIPLVLTEVKQSDPQFLELKNVGKKNVSNFS